MIKQKQERIFKKDSPTGGPFLFIGNPNSGRGGYLKFQTIFSQLNLNNATLVESTSAEHMKQLAREAQHSGYRACVAVGGDGTVHGIARELIETEVALGIIPTGSGNGIARHLNISMDITTAIQQVINGQRHVIDTLTVNGDIAIGFCGVGFDGFVAHRFDQTEGRGFGNYIKLTLKAFTNYKSTSFQIHNETNKYLSIIAANTSQLGNNAYVNPTGIDDDGEFEFIKINTPTPIEFPFVINRLFNKTFHQSKFVTVDRSRSIEISNLERAYLHIDGEPAGTPERIEIKVNPKSLITITP